MDPRLTFEYDEIGDILYIQTVAPYAQQETEQLEYNVFVRRHPRTKVIEAVEVLFFTRWLLRHGEPSVKNLAELFSPQAAAA
jgi:uncharacterized protein YuzE